MVINMTLFVTFFSSHNPYSYFFNSSYFFSKMILKSSDFKKICEIEDTLVFMIEVANALKEISFSHLYMGKT